MTDGPRIHYTPIPLEQVGVSEPLWKPGFLTPLDVTPLDDGKNWRVNVGFSYESAIARAILTVPAGFVTDFASTPRFLWPILWPTGPWGKPSVLHDDLYRTFHLATKAEADRVFLEAMRHLPAVGKFRANLMYEGVHVFGRRSYKGGLG
jgi:hypothetical protein